MGNRRDDDDDELERFGRGTGKRTAGSSSASSSCSLSSSSAVSPLSDFAVDIWFLFGSFAYGVEAQVESFSVEELTVRALIEPGDDAAGLARFLDDLADNPKGLLRAEIRIFAPAGGSQRTGSPAGTPAGCPVASPVTLFTESSPMAESGDGGGVGDRARPLIRFSQLRGLSSVDTQSWLQLVRVVWPPMISSSKSH